MVKHEPIDAYVREGRVTGMDTMVMPFPLGESVSAADIEAGDKVRLTFEVRSGDASEAKAMQVTRLAKLSADTKLHFGKAQPTKAATEPASQ
jgi:hypothetical protein